ncbi:MAG: SH3 domain-containing protein [Reyranella sp.]|nr:SH3 domain-containing protein [Reyranella sp.]
MQSELGHVNFQTGVISPAMRLRPYLLGLLALFLAGGTAFANDNPPIVRKGSGLPIPRFVSLKSDEVNVRAGPGPRYPVDWVFTRKTMPVEIVAEYENWRKVRDWQGTSGWVLQSLLTGKRGFVVASKDINVCRTPAASAEIVAKFESEVVGEIPARVIGAG